MVKIINPLHGTSPLAQAITSLGQDLFGDQAGGAIKREQLRALERGNVETESLMQMLAGEGGAQMLGSSPMAQALIVGSGYKPADFADLGLMGAATEYGARDPRTQNWQVGAGQGYGNTAGAFDARLGEDARQADLASADRRYGVDQSVLQSQREFTGKPMPALDRRGQPVFVAQGDLTRMAPTSPTMPAGPGGMPFTGPPGDQPMHRPVLTNTERQGTLAGDSGDLSGLSPQQQAYIGADPNTGEGGSLRNYVHQGQVYLTRDGKTDIQTGQMLPPGGYLATAQGGSGEVGITDRTRADAESALAAAARFKGLVTRAVELAGEDPTAFGLLGQVQSLSHSAVSFLNNVGTLVGGNDFASGVQALEAKVLNDPRIDQSLFSGIFNENVPRLQAVSAMLAYVGAETIANQSGRDISNQDIQTIKLIIGDPTSILSTREDFLARVDEASRYVEQQIKVSTELLSEGAGGLNAPAAEEAVTRPGVPPGVPAEDVVEDADGNVLYWNGSAWVPAQAASPQAAAPQAAAPGRSLTPGTPWDPQPPVPPELQRPGLSLVYDPRTRQWAPAPLTQPQVLQ